MSTLKKTSIKALREKCPNTESGPYFSAFGLNTDPNTGKYGPEITPYFDTFQAVKVIMKKDWLQ